MVELDMWESRVVKWRNRSKYKMLLWLPKRNATLSLIPFGIGRIKDCGPVITGSEDQALPVPRVKTQMCKTDECEEEARGNRLQLRHSHSLGRLKKSKNSVRFFPRERADH